MTTAMGNNQNIEPSTNVDTIVGATNPLFAYIDSKNYDAIVNEDNVPRTFSRGGIFICLEGDGYVTINEHKFPLSARTMCVAFPGTIIQAFKRNEGFKSYTLMINTDFIGGLNTPLANSIQMFMRENPCMVLSQEQLDSILQICKIMHERDTRTDHPFRDQINRHMLTLLCYELAGIYAHDIPVKREPCSRQDIIFRRFLSLLATDITISREVQYYADKLSLTTRSLNSVCQKATGQNAKNIIIICPVNTVCFPIRRSHTHKSVRVTFRPAIIWHYECIIDFIP